MQILKRKINFFFLLVAFWPGFFFDWLFEWGLVFCLTGYGFFKYLTLDKRKTSVVQLGLYVSFFLLFLGLFSYLVTLIGQRFGTSGRDLLDLLKPVLLYFSCLLPFLISKGLIDEGEIEASAGIVLWYSVFCFLIIQFKVPLLSDFLENFYSGTKTHIADYIVRLTIPFENPNFLGLVSVTCLYIGLNLNKSVNWFLAAPALMCVALSGSRTAWILGCVSILVFILDVIYSFFKNKNRVSPKAGFVIFAIAFIFLSSFGVDDFVGSYQRLSDFIDIFLDFDLGKDESYADRIALREGSWKLILERPILGWGAIKESGFDVVDNQFYGIALRYGIFGVFIFSMYAGYCCFVYIKKMHTFRKKMLLSVYFLILMAWLWTGSYLENIRLVVLEIMLLYSIGIESEKYRPKCSGNWEK